LQYTNIISKNIENYRLGIKIGVPLFDDREIRYHDGTFLRFVLHRPREKEQEGQDVYVELINSATKSIKIHQSMFIPTKPVLEALKAASRRGVDIKIITRAEEKINLPAIKIVGRSYYFEIYKASMEGNAEFYEWIGNGMAASTHAKFMIVDGIQGVIGSYNLEYSSLSNSETLMVFLGEKPAQDLTVLFNRDLTYSRLHSTEELIKYSYPENVKEDRRLNFWKKLEKML
jgi:cardiolipin synthase A/B